VCDFGLVDDIVVEVWVVVIEWFGEFYGDEGGFCVWFIIIVWYKFVDYYWCVGC